MLSSGRFKFCFLVCVAVILIIPAKPCVASAQEVFRVGSYNVENLFDLKHDGTEYPGYIPGAKYGWNDEMLEIKASNIARVLVDLNAEVLALQEVESFEALEYLQNGLRKKGLDYPYLAITRKDTTAVRCALLSMYPVIKSNDIVVPGAGNRNILKAVIEVGETPFVLFVNHWRSRNAPESLRKISAEALYEAVSKLDAAKDYIMIGDFNSNYNEFKIIVNDTEINDTDGKTGINHVLGTISGDRPVDREMLLENQEKRLHYNPWHELEEIRRWSYLFFGRPRTLDHILLPASLFDDSGISYVDNSFDTFDPNYLFKNNRLFRWQRADRGRGRHLGRGYSDHLPIYACFTTAGFEASDMATPCHPDPVTVEVSDLYESKTGEVRFRIENAAVIYKHKNNAVVKQQGGRAVYVYGAAAGLETGMYYNITVNRLKRYYGNMQVNGIESAEPAGLADIQDLLITDTKADLADRSLENEVVSIRGGYYENGRFYYSPGRSIRLFFRNEALVPERSGRFIIKNARIGFHREPEVVIEKHFQIHPLN